jgi:hypothetical protein
MPCQGLARVRIRLLRTTCTVRLDFVPLFECFQCRHTHPLKEYYELLIERQQRSVRIRGAAGEQEFGRAKPAALTRISAWQDEVVPLDGVAGSERFNVPGAWEKPAGVLAAGSG